jgi:hypothetical protein
LIDVAFRVPFSLSIVLVYSMGSAVAVSRRVLNTAARVQTQSGYVGFVMDTAALGQVFSEYFGFSLPIIPLIAPHSSSPGAGKWAKHWPTYQVDSDSPLFKKLKKLRLFQTIRNAEDMIYDMRI